MRTDSRKRVTGLEPATFSLGSCQRPTDSPENKAKTSAHANACVPACIESQEGAHDTDDAATLEPGANSTPAGREDADTNTANRPHAARRTRIACAVSAPAPTPNSTEADEREQTQPEGVDSAAPAAAGENGGNFAQAVAAIAKLPLNDDERAAAVRILLREHDAAGT